MFGKKKEDLVTVYDQQGRELRIRRSDWHNTLRAGLKKIWDDPDKLYAECLGLAHFGDIEVIEEATRRLLDLRPSDPEVIGLRASTLVGLGREKEVEPFINKAIANYGPSAYTCFHQAMAHDRRGEREMYIAKLREGLELDPNHVPLMQHLVSWQQKLIGDTDTDSMLLDLSARKHSWLAACFLAYRRLQRGDKAGATEMYQTALREEGWDAEMLRQIICQLSDAGMHQEAVDLIRPYFKPGMNPEIGFPLVTSLMALARFDEADALLHEIAIHALPPYHGKIVELSGKITNLKGYAGTLPTEEGDIPQPYMVIRPMWWRALNDPEWIAPDGHRHSHVDVTAFAVNIEGASPDGRDKLGRLSRSIPLFIAERLLFQSDCDSVTTIVVVPKRGACVVPAIGDEAYRQMIRPETDFLVRGAIVAADEVWRAEVEIVRVRDWSVAAQCKGDFVLGELGASMQALVHRVSQQLGQLLSIGIRQNPHYLPPEPSHADFYLKCIEQQAALFMVDAGFGKPESIYGRRNILNNLHWLAVNTGCPQAPAMLMSALVSDMAQGSEIYKELRDMVIALVRKGPEESLADLLSPIAYQIYDMPGEFHSALMRLRAHKDDRYQEWLARLE